MNSRRRLLVSFLALACAAACSDATDTTAPRAMSPSAARRDASVATMRTVLTQQILRTTDAPNQFTLSIAGFGPAAVVHVVNGDANGDNRATSATISIDGVDVIGPSDFSKQVARIDRPASLANPSRIVVSIAGKPGSRFTLSIDASAAVTGIIPASGGDVMLLGDAVKLSVPANAVPANLNVTATPVVPNPAEPANQNLVGGSAVEFGPDGTRFNDSVTVTLSYDPTRLPAKFNESAIRLATLVNGEWLPLRGSTVDVAHHTVTGKTTHFSEYAATGTETFVETSVGDSFACGLTPLHDVYCWGLSRGGSLGTTATTATCPSGTTTLPCSSTPLLVSGGIQFASISVGTAHACGLDVDGTAHCWGTNTFGQLGNGTLNSSSAPVVVVGGFTFTRLAAGTQHTCGIATDGNTYCWGDNLQLELGTPTSETCGLARGVPRPCSTVPVLVSATVPFVDVQAGLTSACGLTATGAAWCWGTNVISGALGDGTTSAHQTPVAVSGGLSFSQLSTGAVHTCGISSGAAYCWGDNSLTRELGIGSSTPTRGLVPLAVVGGLTFTSVGANRANDVFTHTCALTPDGAVYCWGANNAGQLGTASSPETCHISSLLTPCTSQPTLVATTLVFRSIAVGLEETCGIATDGEMYCWGLDANGQLGDGTLTNKNAPSHVVRPW
jgi:alpha-tubulin suppressor-like RCC1 family protein